MSIRSRNSIFLRLFFAGIFSLSSAAIPAGVFRENWPTVAFSVLGIVASFAAICTSYTYSKELYPTLLRTTGLGLNASFARLGAISMPMVGELTAVAPFMPMLVYGLFMLSDAVAVVFVSPDTTRIKLPDTLDECEKMAQKPNTWLTCQKNGTDK